MRVITLKAFLAAASASRASTCAPFQLRQPAESMRFSASPKTRAAERPQLAAASRRSRSAVLSASNLPFQRTHPRLSWTLSMRFITRKALRAAASISSSSHTTSVQLRHAAASARSSAPANTRAAARSRFASRRCCSPAILASVCRRASVQPLLSWTLSSWLSRGRLFAAFSMPSSSAKPAFQPRQPAASMRVSAPTKTRRRSP